MRTPRPCRAWREPLRELVDGHASLESVAAVERHAENCAGCAAELDVLRRMRGLLDGASEGELTRAGEDSFIESVFARIDAEAAPSDAIPTLRRAPRRVAALGAASLVLAAAAALFLLVQGDVPRTHAPEESAAAAPRADIASASETAPGDDERPGPAFAGTDRAFVLGDERDQVDVERFSADLDSAILAAGFDAAHSADLQPLLLELGSPDSADVARGARVVLRGDGPALLRGAAARLLGPRADARDRALIRGELESLGLAAARALLDGGERGVALLWNASQKSGAQGAVALDALIAASATGRADPLDAMPPGTDASIAARVAVADPAREASDLLGRFQATGDKPWLDAWATRDDAEEALARQLGRGASRGTARARLVRASSVRPVGAALPLVMDALLDGDGAAPDALAALLPLGGAEALIGATASGRLQPDVEDAAWRAAIGADAGLMLEAALQGDAAAVLVSATARAFEIGTSEGDAGLLLVRLAARASGDRALRPRIDALLHLAAIGPVSGPVAPELLGELAPLRQDPAPRVAAAAWMAWHALGGEFLDAPSAVRTALRRGGLPTALHARLTRAIGRLSGVRRQ